jgi:putative ABC transport system substrate-binding protein
MLSTDGGVIDAFRQWGLPELAQQGFVEGRNLMMESRSSGGMTDPLPALAREILATRPDVVVAVSNRVASVLLSIDAAVPIVMGFAGGDPVAAGLAASLARPGGRVTGVIMLAEELDAKRIEFAHEVTPGARRVGFLVGSTSTAAAVAAVETTARSLGIELVVVRASGADDYGAAFAALSAAQVGALVVGSFPGFSGNAEPLARMALAANLPAFCEWRHMAQAGCLVGYGAVMAELQRRVAFYVVRILRGEAPGEMAMEQAARFELVVNLRTARALGLTVPQSLLARADEVIE